MRPNENATLLGEGSSGEALPVRMRYTSLMHEPITIEYTTYTTMLKHKLMFGCPVLIGLVVFS